MRRAMNIVLAAGLLTLVGTGGSAMANGAEFKVWAVDALVKVTPDMKAGSGGRVDIETVMNEYESGQFVVTAGDRKIDSLTVKVGELSGPSGVKPHVSVHFLGFVPVRLGTGNTPADRLVAKPPVDLPDPLLDSRSVSVEPGKNQPVWITVYVPKSAAPGTYDGKIDVLADGSAVQVPISIRVHDFTLPDHRTLRVTNWFNPNNIAKAHGVELWSEPFWKLLEAYAGCMADHRQNVVITPITSLIKGQDDGKGNLTFDFSVFDRWTELFRKTGVAGTIEGGHLGGRKDWEAKDFDARWPGITNPDGSKRSASGVKVTSEEERVFLSQFLPALQNHLEEKGWLKDYIQHLCDEPIPANAESYRKLASYVRQFAPEFRIVDACMVNDIAGSIDIWVPLTDQFDKHMEFFKDRQRKGDEVWFYTCLAPKGKYMNRFIDYPLIDVRLIHWMNFKYGVTGYLHWGLNYWRADPFTNPEPEHKGGTHLPPGDSHIVYPGKRGPMSSIRFEALRDGVEDFEMLKILAAKDPREARRICESVVISPTEFTVDPKVLREARARLIESLSE